MAADDYLIPVSYTMGIKEQARTNKITFGDGYEQVSPDGINSIVLEVTVVHEHLTDADLNTCLTLLRARKGVTYFLWTPPVAGYNTQRKFRCDSWEVSPLQFNDSKLVALFREVYDL